MRGRLLEEISSSQQDTELQLPAEPVMIAVPVAIKVAAVIIAIVEAPAVIEAVAVKVTAIEIVAINATCESPASGDPISAIVVTGKP